MLSRSCSGSGRELPFLRLQTGLKSQPVSIFTRKTDSIALQKNDTFDIRDYSKGGNEIEKPNTTTVESQYLQIAQTPSLFNWTQCCKWWRFFCFFLFFLNVQIQANVKKITPLYNLSPLVMSPISVLLEFCGWHMFVVWFVFFRGLAHFSLEHQWCFLWNEMFLG